MYIDCVKARCHVDYISDLICKQSGVGIQYEDNWIGVAGEYDPHSDIISVSTHALTDCQSGVCELVDLFGIDTTIVHELTHRNDILSLSDQSDIYKTFMFIDDNCSAYYNYCRQSVDSYYLHDMCEINAEWCGVNFAYNLFVKSFGKDITNNVLCEYINKQFLAGSYFVSKKNYTCYDDVMMAFKQSMNNVLSFNFPVPNMEPACSQILDDYLDVSAGLNQLQMIVACVYKVRNYERKKFNSEYGTDFWINLQNEYPDIILSVSSYDDLCLSDLDNLVEGNDISYGI